MPYSITTQDGITIQNIPDDIDPQSDVLKQRVAAIRGGQTAQQPSLDIPTGGPIEGVPFGEARGESFGQRIEREFQRLPGAPVLSEFAAAINRPVLGALDIIPESISTAINLAGGDVNIPTPTQIAGSQGGFMDPGLARDIVRGVGETVPLAAGGGAALRQIAGKLPAFTAGETAAATAANLAKQAGQTTVAADIGLGTVSAAGQQVGEVFGGDVGGTVGALAAPLAVVATGGILKMGVNAFRSFAKSLSNMSEDGASKLLATAMVREGLSPEDVVAKITQLGPEALPADLGTNFARLLRTASNEVPRIEGRAGGVFAGRQAGQSTRILNALDDASGTSSLNVDDEIVRLGDSLGPEINRLYAAAREREIFATGKIKSILTGDNSAARALRKIRTRIADKIAAGESIPDTGLTSERRVFINKQGLLEKEKIKIGLDSIDLTKQELDDQIGAALRAGRKNKARDIVRVKNALIAEADKLIPEYKRARNLFAGKAQMENAADLGRQFFKLNAREVQAFTQSMGDSERRMFKLGAKQAILDRFDATQINADLVKRVFGKGGDAKKLRSLFDSDEAFKKFSNAMEREANFIITRNAAQANSTTAKQIADRGASMNVIDDTRALLGDPVAATNRIGRIMAGLRGRKTDEAFTQALEDAGDILLTKGMSTDRLTKILREGNREAVAKALAGTLPKQKNFIIDVLRGFGAAQIPLGETQGQAQ